MGATPVCQITTAGCIRPDFAACLTYIQAAYRAIYGQDVILSADSQDGQFMALLANAIHDCNGETLAVYNAFSPATAQGEGLSSVVKINGIRRKSPTYSTCDFINVGQVGATITAGVIRDDAGNAWSLPDFTIPLSGQVLVTGTCQTIGAITLSSSAVDTANGKGAIATPQLGWQSAINPSAAVAGQPVESDSQLRQRQSLSTALPATTVTTSMVGTLSAIAGVGRVKIYENTTNRYDANGVPAHGISVVVEGGDPSIIAQAIAIKKGQGVGTFGDTVVTLTDMYGRPMPVAFFRPKLTAVAWYVTLRAKTGYTLAVANMIRAGLADYTNRIGIGENQELSAAYPVANLTGTPQASAFEIVGLVPKRADQTNDAYGDIAPPFNGALTCAPSDVIITVVNA